MSSILTLTTQDKCDERREDDFYPTPWEATEALLMAEEEWLRDIATIDEPACGEGAMCEIIVRHGKVVHGSDLIDRGFGFKQADFLNQNFVRTGDGMITNPPFVHAEDFIRQAHRLGYRYIAMILKANYWHAGGRVPLFHEFRPVRVRPYSWRIDFTGDGRNHFDCIAVIWMPGASDKCEYCAPLQRPKYLSQPSLF